MGWFAGSALPRISAEMKRMIPLGNEVFANLLAPKCRTVGRRSSLVCAFIQAACHAWHPLTTKWTKGSRKICLLVFQQRTTSHATSLTAVTSSVARVEIYCPAVAQFTYGSDQRRRSAEVGFIDIIGENELKHVTRTAALVNRSVFELRRRGVMERFY